MQPIDSTDPFARPQDPSTHPLGGTATDPLAAGQDSTKQSPEKVPPANLFTFSPFGSLPPVKNNVNQSFGTLNGMAGGGGFGGASLFSSGSSNMGRPGASVGESDQMMGSKASTNDGRQSPRMGPHDGRLDLNLNQERRSPNLANDFYVGHATGGGNLGRLSPILGEHGRGGSPPPPPQQSMEEGKRKSIDDSWVALDWSDLRSSGETSPATDKAAHPLASIPELESKPPTSHKLSIPEGTVRPSFDAPPRSPMREGKEEMRREKSPVHHASVMMTTMAMREIKTLTPQKEPTVPTVPPTISHTPTARPTTDEKNGMEKSEKGTAEMATTTTKTDTPKAAPKAETPKATPKGDTSKATPKMETPKSAPTPATPRSSGRRRKSVDRLSPVPTERAESKAIEVPSGAGTKFGDIPHISKELTKRKSDYPALMTLHRLIFGRPGEAAKRKAHLRLFNGFPHDADVAKIAEKLAHHTVEELRDICVVLNLERSGEKKGLSERIAGYLAKPMDLGESKPAPRRTLQKRGSTGSPKSGGRRKMSKTASGTDLHLGDEMDVDGDGDGDGDGDEQSASDVDEQVMADLEKDEE